MAKRKDKAAQVRLAIGIGAVVVAVVVVGVGLLFSPGQDAPYATLDRPATSVADGSGEIRVVEFFSYTCPHCRSLEELTEDWQEDLPEGVVFERVHVAYSPDNRLLARGYLALARHDAVAANHKRIFRAFHDNNMRFDSADALADFVDGNGVSGEAMLRSMASRRVARRVEADEQRFVELGLTSVPALVVDGKYVVNMELGRKGALDAVDDLVQELLAGTVAEGAVAEETEPNAS